MPLVERAAGAAHQHRRRAPGPPAGDQSGSARAASDAGELEEGEGGRVALGGDGARLGEELGSCAGRPGGGPESAAAWRASRRERRVRAAPVGEPAGEEARLPGRGALEDRQARSVS